MTAQFVGGVCGVSGNARRDGLHWKRNGGVRCRGILLPTMSNFPLGLSQWLSSHNGWIGDKYEQPQWGDGEVDVK